MRPSFLLLLLNKFRGKGDLFRIQILRLLGLRMKDGSSIGRIICEWPNRVLIGKGCTLEDGIHFKISHPFSDGNYIDIKDHVFIGNYCYFNCTSRIIIGNNCMIAANTIFADVGHGTEAATLLNKQPVISEDIVLEDDVWIGVGSIILKGVNIGKGSIIGSGSVVNKSIPEYQIWAGTPARYIRNRI
jgi:acetyltransferase-like isoleucine patch superfamily enzyme